MPEPQLLVYIATSLDGFIATPDGGIGWLDAYPGEDYGYAEFVATIGTIVIGRATYDQVKGFGGWPYSGKRVIVLSSRALDAPPTGAEAYADDIAKLAARLKTESDGDIWLLGGARTIRQFLDLRCVDRMEIFVIPLLLGDGLPLFERSKNDAALRLSESRSYRSGVVRLVYGFAES